MCMGSMALEVTIQLYLQWLGAIIEVTFEPSPEDQGGRYVDI